MLIASGRQPAFAPNGAKLAYTVPSGATSQIWTANADGTNPTVLTNEPGTGASTPAWSPDGLSVLFVNSSGVGDAPVKKINVSTKAVTALGVSGTSVSWQPIARNTVQRVWGQDHITTAVAASQYNFQTKAVPDPNRVPANAVVLSRDDTFFDALVGSALAVSQQAPLLVTNRATLDARAEQEIKRVLGTSGKAYLLGGELALAPAVANRLTSMGHVIERIWGQTHFDTAIEIDKRIVPPNQNDRPAVAIVTTGTNFFDALAAGAAAGANPGTVIVLTNGDQLPAPSAAYLNTLNPDANAAGTQVVTAGGPGDRALRSALQSRQMASWPAQINYKALVGLNEKDSAVIIADYFFAAPPIAAVATNRSWFDALTGGAMVGLDNGPLLITDPTELHPGARDYLLRNSGNVWAGVLLGGAAALPDALRPPIGDAIGLPGQWDLSTANPVVRLPIAR